MALARWSAVGDGQQQKQYGSFEETLCRKAPQISGIRYPHSKLSASSSSMGSLSRDASPRSSQSSISSISESRTMHSCEATANTKHYNYDLPCEFAFVGCERRFEPEDIEDWIQHNISHFAGRPPPFAICTFCDKVFDREDYTISNWKYRMIHIKGHFARDGMCQIKPDYWVVEYLMENDLLNQADYVTALKYVRKPFPADVLRTKGEAEAVKKHRREQLNQKVQQSPVRSEQREELEKQKNIQSFKTCKIPQNAPGARKRATKSRNQRQVVLHQADREDSPTMTAESLTRRTQPQSDLGIPEVETVITKVAYLEQLKAPTPIFSLPSRTPTTSETLCSDDVTDWEAEIAEEDKESTQRASQNNNEQMTAALLSQVKAVLPIKLSEKVWNELLATLTHGTNHLIRQRAGHSASNSRSSSSSITGPASQGVSAPGHNNVPKRTRGDQDDGFEDDGQRLPSPNGQVSHVNGSDQTQEFACPFRKHNSQKYSLRQWPNCALKPHVSVARLKAHLYTYHLIHQCPRCKHLFKSEAEVDAHLKASQGCNLQPEIAVEGITKAMEGQIKSRKKAFKGQTEVNRWEQIYKILFPGEPVPDPYYEPVNEHEAMTSETSDNIVATDFEAHLLQELPRIFQRSLELAAGFDMQPVDTQLRDRAASLFSQQLAMMLTNYRSSQQLPVDVPAATFAHMRITSAASSDSGFISQAHSRQYVNETNLRDSSLYPTTDGSQVRAQQSRLISSPGRAAEPPLSHTLSASHNDAFASHFDMDAYLPNFANNEDIYGE